ncbi:MAG: DUF4157 domain-containing protein [Aestuariibacter sp.]|nr:DUF4157 domain-containing protein [Aestuariibacter sp.]
MIASKRNSNAKENSVTDSKAESKKGGVEAAGSQIQLNPLWHGLATHVGNVATASPSSIQRNSSHSGVSPIQRLPAESDETLNTDAEIPIQLKLTVGAADDPYEKEADVVADKVMRMPAGGGQEEIKGEVPAIQKKPYKSSVHSQKSVAGSVASTIQSPGNGSPLSDSIRSRVEPVLGADLSSVRVHSGSRSRTATADIQAKAFTHKNNIYLGTGQSANDIGLMAHEATHTVQQGASRLTGSIMRFPAVTPTTAETSHTPVTIKAMTLSNFNALTIRQLDWATSAALQADAAALADFRSIKGFSANPGVVAACGGFTVSDLITEGLPAIYAPLLIYTKGVTTATTAWLRRTTTLADAKSWGTSLTSLEAVWPVANLSLVMRAPSPRASKSPFEKLIDPATPELANFIKYLTACSPVLSASNGKEVDSFLDLRSEGAMPDRYFGKINQVVTFHHFTKGTLDGLISNEAFPAWKQQWAWLQRPLTVVLYPAVDHNGAFHRNLGLQSMVTNADILTIVIEGHATVGDYETQLAPVAARYGIAGEIQQAMVGGHGNSTILTLAGTAGASITKDRLGTTGASGANTTSLMTELTRLMSSDPARRRIVLDACLTDSHRVRAALSAPPATAAAEVVNAVTTNPSLRGFVENIAGAGSTVLGANASFAPAQTTFMTPGSTDITLQVPGDPDLVGTKLQYVEFGTEPEGCMRAVLECWADDQITGSTDCRDAMLRRIAGGRSAHVPAARVSPWRESIINPIYDLAANHYWGNGEAIRQLGSLAGSVFELYWDNHTSASSLNNRLSVISGTVAHVDKLFNSVSAQSRYATVPRVAVVIEQAWMQYKAARRSNFMTALGRYASAANASAHVDMALVMPSISHLLTLPPASPPPADQFRIALLAANHQPLVPPVPAVLPRHIDFLRQLLGAGPQFPPALNIGTALGGLTDEEGILSAIGRPLTGPRLVAGGGAAPPPDANIDLDRDPSNLNDFNVTPLSANGIVDTTSSNLMVRSRPTTRTSANIFARLAKGTAVRIIGEYGNWYAIEQPGRTGFVYQRYITIVP